MRPMREFRFAGLAVIVVLSLFQARPGTMPAEKQFNEGRDKGLGDDDGPGKCSKSLRTSDSSAHLALERNWSGVNTRVQTPSLLAISRGRVPRP